MKTLFAAAVAVSLLTGTVTTAYADDDRGRGRRKRRGHRGSREDEHGGGAREGRAPEERLHPRSSSTDRSALRTSFSLTVESGSLTSCAKMTVSAVIDFEWGHYGDPMEDLGNAAGIGIVEDTIARIQALAADAGGPPNPSGDAGGASQSGASR